MLAASCPVCVITGGPGTGKTTILNQVLTIFEKSGIVTALAAPTGRAAKRMEKATMRPAKTIHRLLEFGAQPGRIFLNTAASPGMRITPSRRMPSLWTRLPWWIFSS